MWVTKDLGWETDFCTHTFFKGPGKTDRWLPYLIVMNTNTKITFWTDNLMFIIYWPLDVFKFSWFIIVKCLHAKKTHTQPATYHRVQNCYAPRWTTVAFDSACVNYSGHMLSAYAAVVRDRVRCEDGGRRGRTKPQRTDRYQCNNCGTPREIAKISNCTEEQYGLSDSVVNSVLSTLLPG